MSLVSAGLSWGLTDFPRHQSRALDIFLNYHHHQQQHYEIGGVPSSMHLSIWAFFENPVVLVRACRRKDNHRHCPAPSDCRLSLHLDCLVACGLVCFVSQHNFSNKKCHAVQTPPRGPTPATVQHGQSPAPCVSYHFECVEARADAGVIRPGGMRGVTEARNRKE